MDTKDKRINKSKSKKSEQTKSEDLVQEVKESIEEYRAGNYVKGDIIKIMKDIRDSENKAD